MEPKAIAAVILARYADCAGLTATDAQLLIDEGVVDVQQAKVLQSALAGGKEGIITPEEQQSLAQAGLSGEVVAELSGPTGQRALQARVKWFVAAARTEDPELVGFTQVDAAFNLLAALGPDARPAVELLARNSAESVRVGALKIAQEIGWIFPLIKAVSDVSDRVRSQALESLWALGPKAAIALPALTAQFQRENERSYLRVEILRTMGAIGAVAAPSIGALLDDVSSREQYNVTLILDLMDTLSPKAASVLCGWLANRAGSYEILIQTASLLKKHGMAKEAMAAIVRRMENIDYREIKTAAEALYFFGPAAKEILPALQRVAYEKMLQWDFFTAMVLGRVIARIETSAAPSSEGLY